MANNNASGTFEPIIPSHLLTAADLDLCDAVGVTVCNEGEYSYLFNDGYCTSGRLNDDKEVSDEDLYSMLQDVIKRSEGLLKFITHEQAYTCDKMRRGEFGGCAVFITADDIQYSGTSSWLSRRIHEIESGDTGPDTEEPSDSLLNSEVIEKAYICSLGHHLCNASEVIGNRTALETYHSIEKMVSTNEINLEVWEPYESLSISELLEMIESHADGIINVFKSGDSSIPSSSPAELDEVVEATRDLIDAANLVVKRWESGNLAEAVQNLQMAASFVEYTLESLPPQVETQQPTLVVVLEGGLVQEIVSDAPEAFKGARVVIIDYDTDYLDKDDESLGLVVNINDDLTSAYMRSRDINKATIDIEQVVGFITDKAYGSTQQRFAVCDEYPCLNCPDINQDGNRCVNEAKCLAFSYFDNLQH